MIDFKMKFNPISACETTVNHYGKRGISWHSFCLIYYMYDNEVKEAVRYCTYLDQTLSDGNKQDICCVLSLLNVALAQIVNDILFVKSVVFHSDNSRYYENHFL